MPNNTQKYGLRQDSWLYRIVMKIKWALSTFVWTLNHTFFNLKPSETIAIKINILAVKYFTKFKMLLQPTKHRYLSGQAKGLCSF